MAREKPDPVDLDPTDEQTAPDAVAGDSQDAVAEEAVGEGQGEIFESETDSLSIRQIRDVIGRLKSLPGIGRLSQAVDELGFEGLRELLRHALTASGERPIDRFGFDEAFYEEFFPLVRWVHDHYFRVETTGVDHIPSEGRGLVVANHSGTLPYDGAMVATTVRIHHPAKRHLRPLVENFVYHMPYLGRFMAQAGAVRACQENAQALLEADQTVLVFPEGVKGIGKLYRQRYRLQRFGRGGAIKLAMRTGSPIVPCAVVGAEESMPLLGKVTWLARPLGLPYIPVTPTLPHLGPLGLIPVPTKWFIDFAEPIDVSSYGPDAIDDRVLVNKLNEQVRGIIQDLIDRRLHSRQSVLFG